MKNRVIIDEKIMWGLQSGLISDSDSIIPHLKRYRDNPTEKNKETLLWLNEYWLGVNSTFLNERINFPEEMKIELRSEHYQRRKSVSNHAVNLTDDMNLKVLDSNTRDMLPIEEFILENYIILVPDGNSFLVSMDDIRNGFNVFSCSDLSNNQMGFLLKKFNKIQKRLGRTEVQKKQTTRNGKRVWFYNLIKR